MNFLNIEIMLNIIMENHELQKNLPGPRVLSQWPTYNGQVGSANMLLEKAAKHSSCICSSWS